MSRRTPKECFGVLCEAVTAVNPALSFSIFEIGAAPLGGEPEPFYCILDYFPNSTVTAFEVDPVLCEDLNRKAKPGVRYFPLALGRRTETREFFETHHPMCSSLYRPDEAFLNHYNNLEASLLKATHTLQTVSLDEFVAEHGVNAPDFIKIDIQGAEVEVFQGGRNALRSTVFIVSEVELVPLYVDQPMFGDVCTELTESDLLFHRFLGFGGRTVKPVILDNNTNFVTQEMWADAVFMTHIAKMPEMSGDQLLKLGMLAFMYGSPDVTAHAFKLYDDRHQTSLQKAVFRL